jgi:UDP-glucose 4-epimerase
MGKILVTGGAGFIGAHLVAALASSSDEIVVIDNFKRSSRESLARWVSPGRVRLLEGDIRRFDAMAAAVRGCETVFHLAAQSNVMGAVDDPEYSITTNVLGTFNVLRAAAEAGAKRVVFTSSREVYGEASALPVHEGEPLLAKNPYGASKVAGEAYCRTFANTHRMPVEVVRFANVYGTGDSGRVIPLWLTAAQEGRDVQIYGGDQVIDFLWVETAVTALLYAAARGLPGPVNIGSGVGTKIVDLAARIVDVTRSKSRIVRAPPRGVEVAKFVADTRAMRSLGLEPESDPLSHLGELVAAYPPSREHTI